MKENSFDINEIIIRYLDESSTEVERKYLFDWMKRSKTNQTIFLETRDLWLSCVSCSENDAEVEKALNKLKKRIQKGEQKKQIYRSAMPFLRIAAILVLVFGLGWYFLKDASFLQKDDTTAQSLYSKRQKEPIVLPDGSRVWLEVNTKLVYPQEFTPGKREVWLDGGGFFEITPDKQAPFYVKLGELDIQVLGTQFNVSNYENQENIEAILVSGSILLTGQSLNKPVVLSPNEKFSYSRTTDEVSTEKINATVYLPSNVEKDPIKSEKTNIQPRKISGTITDENGNPMPGVSVRVYETSNGSVTGINGKFTLTIEGNATIRVLYIGYKEYYHFIDSETQEVNIVLEKD